MTALRTPTAAPESRSGWHRGARAEWVPGPNGVARLLLVAVDAAGVPCAARPLRTEILPAPPPRVRPSLPPAGGYRRAAPPPTPVDGEVLPTGAEILAWREANDRSQREIAALLGCRRSMVAAAERDQRPARDVRRGVAGLMAAPLPPKPAEPDPPPAAEVLALRRSTGLPAAHAAVRLRVSLSTVRAHELGEIASARHRWRYWEKLQKLARQVALKRAETAHAAKHRAALERLAAAGMLAAPMSA